MVTVPEIGKRFGPGSEHPLQPIIAIPSPATSQVPHQIEFASGWDWVKDPVRSTLKSLPWRKSRRAS
jgi:hypothetical protein